METISTNQRVLSLVIWPRRFGYVVFENPNTLLDCGLKMFLGGRRPALVPFSTKIARLISEWQPSVIVLKTPKSSRVAQKIKTLQALAKSYQIPVRLVSKQEIKQAFVSEQNKYERARTITQSFPELAIRLPPKKKCWQSEPRRMTMFDAAVVGLTYYRQRDSVQIGLRQAA